MKVKNFFSFLFVICITVGISFLIYYGVGSKNLFSIKNIKQGLDLRGGVSIIYQADKKDPTVDEINSAKSLIQGRLDRKNFTEAEVASQGTNRIRVDIPGVDNAEEAVSEIGKTAQLTFRDEQGNVLLNGVEVKNASKQLTQENGQTNIVVALEFTSEGQKLFEKATEKNIGKRILICLDNDIISMPTVQQKITGGNATITGNFTSQEAEDLAALIRAGSLPFNLNVISLENVGAKLGADALNSSLIAGIIGTVLVILFMLISYRILGFAADIALIIYIGLVLSFLSLFGITLTLPGIAGIILSIGMAVDANVIIFERIKEELNNKKSMRASIKAGFSKAFSAIFDGNITTLLAAVVLYCFGSGPIKGFSQTLSLGIIVSMFTALVITRLIINNIVGMGLNNPIFFGVKGDSSNENNRK
jgi:protein-export membrane protein, SecD/SecF family/protein-export membrane protein SecD